MPSTVEVKLRSYRSSDLESCRTLWTELSLWHRRIYGERKKGSADPGRHFDAYLKKNGREGVFVAEADDAVVGMAGLIKGKDGYELEPLIVLPKHRGHGIGRKLTEAVIHAAREKDACYLTVRPVARNDPAIRFFHGLGFDVLGHIEMFVDFETARRKKWKGRKRLAGRDFRY